MTDEPMPSIYDGGYDPATDESGYVTETNDSVVVSDSSIAGF